MKYQWVLFLFFAFRGALAAEPTWVCSYQVQSSEAEQVSRVKNFISLSDGLLKKAIPTSRGPVMAEVYVEKNAKGQSEVFPKLKFGMDRMPSASLPTRNSEAVIKISAENNQPALEVKLFCSIAK